MTATITNFEVVNATATFFGERAIHMKAGTSSPGVDAVRTRPCVGRRDLGPPRRSHRLSVSVDRTRCVRALDGHLGSYLIPKAS